MPINHTVRALCLVSFFIFSQFNGIYLGTPLLKGSLYATFIGMVIFYNMSFDKKTILIFTISILINLYYSIFSGQVSNDVIFREITFFLYNILYLLPIFAKPIELNTREITTIKVVSGISLVVSIFSILARDVLQIEFLDSIMYLNNSRNAESRLFGFSSEPSHFGYFFLINWIVFSRLMQIGKLYELVGIILLSVVIASKGLLIFAIITLITISNPSIKLKITIITNIIIFGTLIFLGYNFLDEKFILNNLYVFTSISTRTLFILIGLYGLVIYPFGVYFGNIQEFSISAFGTISGKFPYFNTLELEEIIFNFSSFSLKSFHFDFLLNFGIVYIYFIYSRINKTILAYFLIFGMYIEGLPVLYLLILNLLNYNGKNIISKHV